MKNLLAILAVVALSAGAAVAGDGNVPQSTLSSMGLSGLKSMTDTQGLNVRGMGAIASVSGSSFAVQVGLGGLATAQSDYFGLGFGVEVAGAEGASISQAHNTFLGTPIFGVNASTASGAVAFGQ